jgi:hypothetical protein
MFVWFLFGDVCRFANIVVELYFLLIIKVLNLLILFIQMCGNLHLFVLLLQISLFFFMNDSARVTWIFLMKDKSKVFLNGFRMVLIQFENLIKRLSCDIGNEYV